jgi:hypothetical protein
MNTEDKTAVIVQITYRDYLIAQIASGIAGNPQFAGEFTDSQLAEFITGLADEVIKKLNSEAAQ